MKRLLFVLLLLVGVVCANSDAYAQKPLFRMTDEEVSALPTSELTKRVVDGWDDMLLNIYFGMNYSDLAAATFSLGFQKGMEKWSKSLPQGSKMTKKQILVSNVFMEFTNDYLTVYKNFPQAAGMFYKERRKRDTDTVLSLKAKAIQEATQVNWL